MPKIKDKIHGWRTGYVLSRKQQQQQNNKKTTTKYQQNIKTMCIPQTSIYLTFVSVSCIILQLYKPIANSKQQFHTHK